MADADIEQGGAASPRRVDDISASVSAIREASDRKNWLTIRPAGTDQSSSRKQPLLINNRPLDAFSPLGQPEPQRQWMVVSALMFVAVGQGVAVGGMEVLVGCAAANGYLGLPQGSVAKYGDIVRAVGLFVFAPLGGYLVDKRFNNWTIQVGSMALWAVGCILLLLAGFVAQGPDTIRWNPAEEPVEAGMSTETVYVGSEPTDKGAVIATGGWSGIPAAFLGWIGLLLAGSCASMDMPLSTLLVADQIKRPAKRGAAIAWYFLCYSIGHLLSLAYSERRMDTCKSAPVPVAASVIPCVAVACTVLVVLRNRLLADSKIGLAAWRPWQNLQDGQEQEDPDADDTASCFKTAVALVFTTSEPKKNKNRSAENLALWGMFRVFVVAAMWSVLVAQSTSWATQAEGLNHYVCYSANSSYEDDASSLAPIGLQPPLSTARRDVTNGTVAPTPLPPHPNCIVVSDLAVQITSLLLAFFVFAMLMQGGFSLLGSCFDSGSVHLSPLSKILWGYHLLTMAFFCAGVLQLVADNRQGGKDCPASDSACAQAVSVLWQIPQYVLMALSLLLVTIHALEYAYAASTPWTRGIVTSAFYSIQGLGFAVALTVSGSVQRSQLPLHIFAGLGVSLVVSALHQAVRPTWWSLEMLC